MKSIVGSLVGVGCICLSLSCGGDVSHQPNMSGNWTFIATPEVVFPAEVSGTGKLNQSGNSITGALVLTGTPCATSGALTGTVNGTTLTLQIDENGQSVSFTGTVNKNFTLANGVYISPSGGCTSGNSGHWSATKG
jgi:hypothetical protein